MSGLAGSTLRRERGAAIDRRAVVDRHSPSFREAHPTNAFTIGNGDLAMTVDVTGLQTFPAFHELRPDPLRIPSDGAAGLPEQRLRAFDRDDFQIPLRTQSSWGWYASRPRRPVRFEETETLHETRRGPVPFADRMGLLRAGDDIPDEEAAGAWFHFNPRRTHLGRLTLDATVEGLVPSHPGRLGDVAVRLDLWTGTVSSRFTIAGESVDVTTVAHPHAGSIAVRVESSLLAKGLAVSWVFDAQPDDLATFEHPLVERIDWSRPAAGSARAVRRIEDAAYAVEITTTGSLAFAGGDRATAVIAEGGAPALEVVATLSPAGSTDVGTRVPSFAETRSAAHRWWSGRWSGGAAVSFDDSSDTRALELERRIVLSRYLTAVNCAGSTPPAETGLTYNSWSGKFHLEMHWWHAAHFPLWGEGALLERSIGWYHRALPAARETARRQGYAGARWPKQVDPTARESPSHIGVFLIWQQPHVIHLLELLRSEGRDEAFLREHYPLVEATADFMADIVVARDGEFILPPPLIPAQESYLLDRDVVTNPTFELAYWSWALRTANEWRRRLGLGDHPRWADVGERMARPTVLPDGGYAAVATPRRLIRTDHPSLLMALGWVPDTPIVDERVMERTLDSVLESWDLQSSWGWDYPVMAMTAARLGRLGDAIDTLLLPTTKNAYLPNGHAPQMPGFLSLYLPANGGLLAAVAHLVAAVERGHALPQGWSMRAEGFPGLVGTAVDAGGSARG